MTTERPILFSEPMVRALLAGTKTQTRRAWKMPRGCIWYGELGGEREGWFVDEEQPWWLHVSECRCAYGSIGDHLWVREAWRTDPQFDYLPPRDLDPAVAPVQYEAGPHADVLAGKLRPSMFMPRWASRITLEITEVRVERLQDISADDAIAEGLTERDRLYATPGQLWQLRPRDAYRDLWESINGHGSWDENPWVWVVAFRRLGGKP